MSRKTYPTHLLCPLILLVAATSLGATTNETITADYAPFLSGKPWPRFPVVTYVESASNIWIHPLNPKRFPTVTEVHDPDSDSTTTLIQFPDGRRFESVNTFTNEFMIWPFLSVVHSGDFNGDGKPDFVMVKPGSGCGLAAEYCSGVFAFSDGDNYRFTCISTMGLGPHDLVLDPQTKTFRLIETSFRQGVSTDGKTHSFWGHRFYKWDNLRFQRDDRISAVWIQYLNRPNHEPTKLRLKAGAVKAPRIDW